MIFLRTLIYAARSESAFLTVDSTVLLLLYDRRHSVRFNLKV